MKQPLISVIVPIFNIERYAGICIESIINQRYGNLEIILIDDGSDDRCPEICDLYASKDDRIRVIHKEHEGLVAARKTGMRATKGEYIAYVDGDDWIASGYFSSVAGVIMNENPDVIICDWTRVLFDQHIILHNNTDQGNYTGERLEQLRSHMISCGKFHRHGISTFLWNKVFKREIVYDWQMNVDERIVVGEDACVTYAALLKSHKVSVMDNSDYHYRQREDSLLKRTVSYSLEAGKLKALYDNLIAITGEKEELQRQAEDYVLVSCIIRSGGLCPDGKHYIFGDEFVGKDIVVYSAGTFGQLFVSQIKNKHSCNLVGWVDDDYWEYRRCCLNVDPVEDVTGFSFDYLIIAAADGDISDDIRQRLLHLGVEEYKILTMDVPRDRRGSLLNQYMGGTD